jgi:hypothetical protein
MEQQARRGRAHSELWQQGNLGAHHRFVIENGLFRLELVSGHIYPNPELQSPLLDEVDACIQRLKLDDQGCKKVRARHFSDYIQGFYTAEFLRQRSPFVWFEARRQGLL